MIILAGADYITFDGIDLQENALNTTATMQMEWGYALVKKNSVAPIDGCQIISIRNCSNQVQIDWSMPGTQWVSVIYNTPAGCTATTPGQLNISVNPLPANPGSIYGLSSVCAGTEGVAYSVDPVPNTDNYFWQLPEGVYMVELRKGKASISRKILVVR